MYVSNVIVFCALRIAASIAGKISSPLRSTWNRLPPTSGGPSSTPMERRNCGSLVPYSRGTCCSIFFSPDEKLTYRSAASDVSAMLRAAIAQAGHRLRRLDRDELGDRLVPATRLLRTGESMLTGVRERIAGNSVQTRVPV